VDWNGRERPLSVRDFFARTAQSSARQFGSPIASAIAVGSILVWAATGPYFQYSDTWQLIVNSGTNIITFIMVFLIQHTQNHDTAAIQMKLDELIRVTEAARNRLVQLEDLPTSEIEEIKASLGHVAKHGGTGKIELEEAKASLREAEHDIGVAHDKIEAATRKTDEGVS
jgi:low affinity Fe/Cu permease